MLSKIYISLFAIFLVIGIGSAVVFNHVDTKEEKRIVAETVQTPQTDSKYKEEDFSISAQSYAVFLERESGMISLLEASSTRRLPIASITKLATVAGAPSSLYERQIEMGSPGIIGRASMGRYASTTSFRVKDLIVSALVESDNDAARALCSADDVASLSKMRNFALRAGAASLRLFNCTGLDNEGGGTNTGTAIDAVYLLREFIHTRADLLQYMQASHSPVYTPDGVLHHTAESTHKELLGIPQYPILAAKTGTTPQAGENIVVALRTPRGTVYISILGSRERYHDLQKILGVLLAKDVIQ